MICSLMRTKPDVSNAVGAVARHNHNTVDNQSKAVTKIVSHLHGTSESWLNTFVQGSGLDSAVCSVVPSTSTSLATKNWVPGRGVTLGGATVCWART